jgi:hypothetical protein
VKEWKRNPPTHLKAMKTAWYEWNFTGIKELHDQPGKYLFMRAILQLTDDEESSESQKPPAVTDGTSNGIKITDQLTKKLTAKIELNPFFMLAASMPCTWAMCPSSGELAPLTDFQSFNLLERLSIEPEGDPQTQYEKKE